MRAALSAVLASVLLLSGCSRGSEPADVLASTAERMSSMRSGELTLEVMASGSSGERAGFRLAGLFALAGQGNLPVASMKYTQIRGDQQEEIGFISDGKAAFVESEGEAYVLPPDQTQQLRSRGSKGNTVFRGIDLNKWFTDRTVSQGGSVDGVETLEVSGKVDAAAALNGIFGIARAAGGGAFAQQSLSADEARQVRAAVGNSRLEIITGESDRYLRDLVLLIEFRAPPKVRPGLEELLRARLEIEARFRKINDEVQVLAPPDPRPYSELVPNSPQEPG